MCSVREYGLVKDLLRRWATVEVPGMVSDMSPSDDDNEDVRAPHSTADDLFEAVQVLLDCSKHRAAEIRYFSSPYYFTSLDTVTTTGILAHGHQVRRCTAAADSTGLGVDKLRRCLEAVLTLPSSIVRRAYEAERSQSDLVHQPRTVVRAVDVIHSLATALFGPSGPLEDPESISTLAKTGPTNYDRLHKAITSALKTLYIAVGGTSSLAGNLGETGLPIVHAIDLLFTEFGAYIMGPDGEILLSPPDASAAVAEFSSVLAWLGLLPRTAPPTNRTIDIVQVHHATLFGQWPLPLVGSAARRLVILLEYRVCRTNGASITVPKIHKRTGTLASAIRGLIRTNLMPRSMAAFSQAPYESESRCFAASNVVFDSSDTHDKKRSDQIFSSDDCIVTPQSHLLSPSVTCAGPRPAFNYISAASKLLISRAGDSFDLTKAFGRARMSNCMVGVSLFLGGPNVDDWETLIEAGDLIEIGGTAHHVVEVNLNSANSGEVQAHPPGLLGLIAMDDPTHDDVIVYLQAIATVDGADSGSDVSMAPATISGEFTTLVDSVWLRKRVVPMFVNGRGEYRFNDSLPQLTPESQAVAEVSVTSHLTSLQQSKLKASESLRQMSQSGHPADTMVDSRSRKQLLDTLQQFYFIGVLIGFAVTTNQPIRIKLPTLLFRVLKSYRPSAAPAVAEASTDINQLLDPTSSSYLTAQRDTSATENQPTYSCHFVPTVEDLREKGADAYVERVEAVRRMDWFEFDALLDREHVPADTTKESYIRDFIVGPNVVSPTLRIYLDATFIALADSGIVRSMTWQLSSPSELRDLCCGP
jgi:hypothetical protein